MPDYCECVKPNRTRDYPDSCYCGKRVIDWPARFAKQARELELVADVDGRDIQAALDHARARELAGRETFGQSFLTRDLDAETGEELADALCYQLLRAAQGRRPRTRLMLLVAAAYRELTS